LLLHLILRWLSLLEMSGRAAGLTTVGDCEGTMGEDPGLGGPGWLSAQVLAFCYGTFIPVTAIVTDQGVSTLCPEPFVQLTQ